MSHRGEVFLGFEETRERLLQGMCLLKRKSKGNGSSPLGYLGIGEEVLSSELDKRRRELGLSALLGGKELERGCIGRL